MSDSLVCCVPEKEIWVVLEHVDLALYRSEVLIVTDVYR